MGTTRTPRGVTLVELVLALLVTALIALCVASILEAATYGTSSQRDARRVAARAQQVRARMDDAIRSSRAVLAGGAGYVVLWRGDTRANNQVNLSELQLIELPAGGTALFSYTTQFPTGWSQAQIDAADVAYAAGSNFATVAQTAKAGGYFPATTWAQGVSTLTLALDAAAPGTRLASWNLTLTNELLTETLIGSAAPREPGTPQ